MGLTFATDIENRKYKGLSRAALEMAYCNGGVNRNRSEADVLYALDDLLKEEHIQQTFDLAAIDTWLNGFSSVCLQEIVDGEEETVFATMQKKLAPQGTNEFLNILFEEVA